MLTQSDNFPINTKVLCFANTLEIKLLSSVCVYRFLSCEDYLVSIAEISLLSSSGFIWKWAGCFNCTDKYFINPSVYNLPAARSLCWCIKNSRPAVKHYFQSAFPAVPPGNWWWKIKVLRAFCVGRSLPARTNISFSFSFVCKSRRMRFTSSRHCAV